MRRLSPRRPLLVLASMLLAPVAVAVAQSSVVSTEARLETLWEPGLFLFDDDGDGFVERVDVGLQIASARPAATGAAADLAARIGFETLSIDLPLPNAGGAMEFVVDGRPDAAARARLGEGPPLPGRGYVYLEPDDTPRLLLWGDDDSGLAAAAAWLAGRLPALWEPEGLTLAETLEGVGAALSAAGVTGAELSVRGVVVRADLAGVERLLLHAEIAAEAFTPTVRDSLRAALPDVVGEVRFWLAGNGSQPVTIIQGSPLPEFVATVRRGSGRERMSLATLYEPGGLLGDEDGDRVPDATELLVSVASGPLRGVADLAARVGVESAGITLPFAVPAERIGDPAASPLPLLLGAGHPDIERMARDGQLGNEPVAGVGRLEVVPEAFEERMALVARGDGPGLDALLGWLSATAPKLSARGLDRSSLSDVEEALWRFLTLRSPGGQAAGAVYALEQMLEELPDDAERLSLTVATEKSDSGLAAELERRMGGRNARIEVENLDVAQAPPLLDRSFEIEGEVAELADLLVAQAWPAVTPGSVVDLEARLSEPRAVRAELEERIRGEIVERGGSPGRVVVLPAYKQGFGWVEESVLPRLRELGASEILIRFAQYSPPEEWPGQAMGTPTRWLLELFPIDEILSRELGLPLTAIRFEEAAPDAPTYELVARDAAGAELLRETFEPAAVVRPYFDVYPRYERVRVTTGWVRARVDGEPVIDRRIRTDVERVWDLYQEEVLSTLHDYVLTLHEGRPEAALAPHFGELRIEVELSEPERALGVDQERIAPMESLHEELYFGTLHFMDLLGRVSSGSPLSYPGRVIPVVRPLAHGAGGRVRFRLTGFRSPGPRVELRYLQGGRERRLVRDLVEIDIEDPLVTAVTVGADPGAAVALEIYVPVDSIEDRRPELVRRTAARRVDGSWLAAARVERTLALLAEFRAAGMYRAELAFDGMGELRVLTATGHELRPRAARVATLAANGDPPSPPDPARLLMAETPGDGTRLVQWRTPIPPAEAHAIVATLAAEFDEARAVKVGDSYLGKPIWAIELTTPMPGAVWSRAKLAELKPTLVYSARQHANEVSSTSHVLRFAEELLADPARRAALDHVNVVVHPVTNPDGAQLAYDLWQITPDHMLHAGYLGSLSVDVTAGGGDRDPIYPESNVRERLWEAWRPDIFLNPHGYPSHEWVQLFSEYAGWVRHRTTRSRDWWGMRGWFMPGFSYLDDPDYPRHREEAFRLRDYITRAINSVEPVAALNRRAYDRYRRYGAAHDPEAFKLDFADDVLIYTAIEGSRAGGGGWVERNPKVTIWAGSTEAPDETAHGDWLELVASAGLAWDRAILDYLLEGVHEVERIHEAGADGARLRLHRERPGRAPGSSESDGDGP